MKFDARIASAFFAAVALAACSSETIAPSFPDAPKDGGGDTAPANVADAAADTATADVETPVIPDTCVALAGQYLENEDNFTLTQTKCESLEWDRAADSFGGSGWKHLYKTDGVTRAVKDEDGNAISERAHYEKDALLIDRQPQSGAATHYRVYVTDKPCDLLNPDPNSKYLTRETLKEGSNVPTDCQFWSTL